MRCREQTVKTWAACGLSPRLLPHSGNEFHEGCPCSREFLETLSQRRFRDSTRERALRRLKNQRLFCFASYLRCVVAPNLTEQLQNRRLLGAVHPTPATATAARDAGAFLPDGSSATCGVFCSHCPVLTPSTGRGADWQARVCPGSSGSCTERELLGVHAKENSFPRPESFGILCEKKTSENRVHDKLLRTLRAGRDGASTWLIPCFLKYIR